MASIELSKAALLRLGAVHGVPPFIVFQYNPETLRHSLHAGDIPGVAAASNPSSPATGRPASGGGLSGVLSGLFRSQSSSLGSAVPPTATVTELIRFTMVLDRADAMQTQDPQSPAVSTGLHPNLSALELLLREDAQPRANAATLFVWGAHRRLPVRLIGLDVHERLFDPGLNPLHATVHVTLQALDGTEPGTAAMVRGLFTAHQDTLRSLAAALASTAASMTVASAAP
jgi:hypothetical protein